MSDKKAEYKSHPSWGMVRFDRVTHGGGKPMRLFGSSLEHHGSSIQLTVSSAERKHDLGQDWYYADRELIRVELSAAQFAELLTSLNAGGGVPCTVHHVQGQHAPEPPEDKVEVERVRESFTADMEALAGKLKKLTNKAVALLNKAPSATERKETRELIAKVVQDIEKNMPFMLSQFQEATEKVATAQKAEVDAFLTHAIAKLGLQALQDKAAATPERPLIGLRPEDVKSFAEADAARRDERCPICHEPSHPHDCR